MARATRSTAGSRRLLRPRVGPGGARTSARVRAALRTSGLLMMVAAADVAAGPTAGFIVPAGARIVASMVMVVVDAAVPLRAVTVAPLECILRTRYPPCLLRDGPRARRPAVRTDSSNLGNVVDGSHLVATVPAMFAGHPPEGATVPSDGTATVRARRWQHRPSLVASRRRRGAPCSPSTQKRAWMKEIRRASGSGTNVVSRLRIGAACAGHPVLNQRSVSSLS